MPDVCTRPPTLSPDASVPPRGRRRTAAPAALIVLAGVLLHSASLGWGFFYDDYLHQYVLRGYGSATRLRPWSLYDFLDAKDLSSPDQKLYLWWMDPQFKARFFRPVTSVSIWLDYKLFGDWAPGYHLTNLLLFALFLLTAFRLYRDLGAPAGAALWALAFLAFEDNHCMPVGWIANRNTLVSALFVAATMLAVHRHHRSPRRRLYFALAVPGFLLALGAKESGIMVFPLTVLYLWFLGESAVRQPIGRRVAALARSPLFWLFGLTTAAYLGFYLLSGYGTCSMMYLTPWAQPLGFLKNFLLFLPLGLLSLLFGVSCDLLLLYPHLKWPIAAAGVPLLVLTGLAVIRVAKARPLLAFCGGWIAVSILCMGGIEPYDRLLMEASIASSLVVGLFLHRLGSVRELWAARRYPYLLLAGLIVLTGIAGSIPSIIIKGHVFSDLGRLDTGLIRSAGLDMNRPSPRHVVVVNSPTGLGALTFGPTWAVLHDDPDTVFYLLQAANRAITWMREDDRTLIVTTPDLPLLAGMFEVLARDPDTRLAPGMTWRTPLFTATALEADERGVRGVRLRFARSLDDPAIQFLAFENGRFVLIAPPPVGRTLDLPAVPKLRRFSF